MNTIMMRAAGLGFALMSAIPAMAEAPAAQPDNAALLRALEALTARLDRLENNDRKRERPATSTVALPAAKPAAPKGKAVPGWFVRLIPWSQDGEGEPVAGFPGPMFDFNFDMHSRYITGQNRFIYNGVSILNVTEDGIYVFSMILDPVLTGDPISIWNSLWFNCSGSFYVGGNRLITGTTAFGSDRRPERDVYRSQSYFGSVRLTPGTHRVEFKVDCGMTQEKNVAVFDKWLPYWKKNRFKLMLKTPADTAPRPSALRSSTTSACRSSAVNTVLRFYESGWRHHRLSSVIPALPQFLSAQQLVFGIPLLNIAVIRMQPFDVADQI